MNTIIHFGQNEKPKQTCAELLLAMVGAWVPTPMEFLNTHIFLQFYNMLLCFILEFWGFTSYVSATIVSIMIWSKTEKKLPQNFHNLWFGWPFLKFYKVLYLKKDVILFSGGSCLFFSQILYRSWIAFNHFSLNIVLVLSTSW